MNETDVAAIVEGIAPVVREFVQAEVQALAAHVMATAARVDSLGPVVEQISAMRERVAVLETRAPVPGPPGAAGRDGLGFDDLTVEQTEATITVKAVRGDVSKVIGTATFPVMYYAGDYEPGRAYLPGQIVRKHSALWHCVAATSVAPDALCTSSDGKPAGPQGKDFWRLLIRDGKRGTDGKHGDPGPAGKAGRDWQQVYDDAHQRSQGRG